MGTDFSGNKVWSQFYDGDIWNRALSIKSSDDGSYIIPTVPALSPGKILKVDSYGNYFGSCQYESEPSFSALCFAKTSDGGSILGGSEGRLIKLDRQCDRLWSYDHIFNDTADPCLFYSIEQTNDGGFIIGGWADNYNYEHSSSIILKTDPRGSMEWGYPLLGYGVFAVHELRNGGYIFAQQGRDVNAYYAARICNLIKIDMLGNMIWNTEIVGNSGTLVGKDMQILQNDDGFIICGSTTTPERGLDVFLTRISSNGDEMWQKTYGGSADDSATALQLTDDGGIIVTGYSINPDTHDREIYLLKVDSSGNL